MSLGPRIAIAVTAVGSGLPLFDFGATARFDLTVTDVTTGALLDPSTLVLTLMNPAGLTTTLTYGTDTAVTKSATGTYAIETIVNVAGGWTYKITATGPAATGVKSGSFWVALDPTATV